MEGGLLPGDGKTEYCMKLGEIRELLRAQILSGEDRMDMLVDIANAGDLMSDMLTVPNEETLLVTGLCNIQTIRTSLIAGVKAVVFVRGKTPSVEVLDLARRHDLPVLSTSFSLFTSCGKLFAKGIQGIEQREGDPEFALGSTQSSMDGPSA